MKPYCPPGYLDHEDRQGNLLYSDWRQHDNSSGLQPVSRIGSNRYSRLAGEVCDMLKSYFSSHDGALPWQEQHIHS